MSEYNDFYTPEGIDEQVNVLLHTRNAPAGDQRMASDLRTLAQDKDAGLDEQSLQRVLSRLLGQQSAGNITPMAEFSSRRQQRGGPVLTSKQPGRSTRGRLWRTFTTLAAVLVVTFLVGSMLLIVRGGSSPFPGGQGTVTVTPSPTPTPIPPRSEGQLVYASEPEGLIISSVWSPNGQRMAAVLDRTTVESWDALTGQHVLKYPVSTSGFNPTVASVAWSPNGSILAAAEGSTIYLFDASTAKLIKTITPPLATGSTTNPALASSHATGREPLSSHMALSGANYFTNAVWSPDGQYLAAGYTGSWHGTLQYVYVWNAANDSLLKILYTSNAAMFTSVGWSPRGDQLDAIGTGENGTNFIRFWNTTSWSEIGTLLDVSSLAWSPDESRLAVTVTPANNIGLPSIRIFNESTGQVETQFSTDIAPGILQWFPDGTRLLVGDGENDVLIWNVASNKQLYKFPHTNGMLSNPLLSPDGQYLACVGAISHLKAIGQVASVQERILVMVA